jgi:hypothetical protein
MLSIQQKYDTIFKDKINLILVVRHFILHNFHYLIYVELWKYTIYQNTIVGFLEIHFLSTYITAQMKIN